MSEVAYRCSCQLQENILEVRNLKVHFPVKKGVFSCTCGYVKAVDDVSFAIRKGEILGIVGESGCGKSTMARAIMGLIKPTGGSVSLNDSVSMVFQDPLGSLNPRMTVRSTLEEVLSHASRLFGKEDAVSSPLELLSLVGIDGEALDKYPYEFSGGERQRICIARAIAARPKLLICDEAVSALDLSIRSQILDLLCQLRRKLDLSMMFITHDLGVVQHLADRIIVMRHGRITEEGPCEQVLKTPHDEYTRYLISSVPKIGKMLT